MGTDPYNKLFGGTLMSIIRRGIYIDAAGTPGVESKSEYLPEDRKSFCAVIVPETVVTDLSATLDIFYRGIRQDFGADELHFTDIYSGRGPWKGVDVDKRIEIFDLMLKIMRRFALPVIYQTSSESFETGQMSAYEQ